jgi:hypothetical protein
MKSFTRRGFCSLAVLAATSLSLRAATSANETAKIVSAANAFLASLDAGQRRSVMYAFDENSRERVGRTFQPDLCLVAASR